jgi:hypothetical protein
MLVLLMAARHAKFVGLFPTARAIPEEMQIGRTATIDTLEGVVLGGTSVLLLERRRIGKSSVALAVVSRVRSAAEQGALALHVDLRYGTRDSVAVARELLSQARSQGADRRVALLHQRGKLSRLGEGLRDGIAEAGKLFDAPNEAQVASRVANALAGAAGAAIGDALTALDAYGRVHGRRVVIFIDEVQELAKWTDAADVQRAIAGVEARAGCQVSFIFAGSEASSIDTLFTQSRELDFVGQRLELPRIPLEEWQRGLPPRFAEAGLVIASAQIAQIDLETDGHPLKTMSVCAQCLVVVPGDEVTAATVRQAIAAAREHPSWRVS